MQPTPAQQKIIDAAGGLLAFQKATGFLDADGDFGPRSSNAVLRKMLGLPAMRIPSASPGKDKVGRPDLDALHGAFTYEYWKPADIKEEKDKGRIIQQQSWIDKNIVEKVLWDGYKVKLHRDVAEEFDFIVKEAVENSGYHPAYIVGHKPRHTGFDRTRALAVHSWGVCVDFECDNNDAGGIDRAKKNKDGSFGPSRMRCHPKFAETFKFYGWVWLGDLPDFKDDMHLQRCKV